MPRPKKDDSEKRRHYVHFRLSDEEWKKAAVKAEAVGLSVPLYMRQAGLKGRVTIRSRPVANVQLVAEVNRIGVNLNQLVRAFHCTGHVPERLQTLCDEIENTVLAAMQET